MSENQTPNPFLYSENVADDSLRLQREEKILLWSVLQSAVENELPLHTHSTAQKLQHLIQDAKHRRQLLHATAVLSPGVINENRDALRESFRTLAGLAPATDVQSPSFDSAGPAAKTRITSDVRDRQFDYKRSRHHDGFNIESKLKSLLVGDQNTSFYLFNSGMAAVSTVLTWLCADIVSVQETCLVGTSCYYETKVLAGTLLRSHCKYIDDVQFESLINAVHSLKPRVLLFDTISTNLHLNFLPSVKLLEALALEYSAPLTIVIDHTCGISSHELLEVNIPSTMTLVIIESLAKYHQFGLDTVTGGIVYVRGLPPSSARIERFREYCGTNLSDSSVLAIPMLAATCSEELFKATQSARVTRLRLQERNAKYLAALLVSKPNSSILKVYHPSLTVADLQDDFSGTLLNVVPRWPGSSPDGARRIISRALQQARERGLSLVGGASFGFDTTRIFPSNLDPESNSFYIRVACGTEELTVIKLLSSIITQSIETTIASATS